MVEGHGGHTAVLLLDGTVLVAGGCCDASGSFVTSAELYDPSSGSWSSTGNMIEVRADAAITLLRDGRVLATGGQYFGLGTAELYDPSSGTWSATGSMAEGRIGHAAALLPDGTVLVAGGYTNDSSGNFATMLASAELYDPGSGTWTATGNMIEARADHTATSLPDGTVLVAGGSEFNSLTNFASTELYDPSSGTWTSNASMIEARAYHAATLLLNGKVLVAGGRDSGGGISELYDPGSGT
jgi:N-acetylneuraminic acid mutarotase